MLKLLHVYIVMLHLGISKPFIVTRIIPLIFCCDCVAVIDNHKCFIIFPVILWDGHRVIINDAFTGVVCSDRDHRIV